MRHDQERFAPLGPPIRPPQNPVQGEVTRPNGIIVGSDGKLRTSPIEPTTHTVPANPDGVYG